MCLSEFEKLAFHPSLLEYLLVKPLRLAIEKVTNVEDSTTAGETSASEALPLTLDQMQSG